MTLAGRIYLKAVALAQEALATVTAIAEFTHGALEALGNVMLGTVRDDIPESGEIPTGVGPCVICKEVRPLLGGMCGMGCSPPGVPCLFCAGAGGVRVPCAGCGKVGP